MRSRARALVAVTGLVAAFGLADVARALPGFGAASVAPLTLVAVSPHTVDAGKVTPVELTYQGKGAGAQVAVRFRLFDGNHVVGSQVQVATLAGSPAVASVPLDLSQTPNVTRVEYRATAFTIGWTSTAPALHRLSAIDRGWIKVNAAPANNYAATLVSLTASEFGGGFGAPPPYPMTPPPPAITFVAHFQNTGTSDLDMNDPTLGVQVQFMEITATGTGPLTTITGRLNATIAAGQTGEESVGHTLTATMDHVRASVALVRLDANGNVTGSITQPSSYQDITVPIYFPP